jgi:large subunit ribosomal protein L5e
MAFMKVLKTPAFFKRYQVPKRRRRSGQTDFAARRVMIHQDKNKYNAKKYRLIVRLTNTKVICQVAYATIIGDFTVCQANSGELEKFGIPVGLKNYAACYATGLLAARRCLKIMGMDEDFKGKEEIDGEEFHVEDEETEAEKRPFKVILDVGIRRTCVGARIWGALKGAADGGLHVPHKIKNFPGYEGAENKGDEAKYEAEAHKSKIFGEHVKEYMETMSEEDSTKYEAHFAKYIAAGIDADGLEDMYTNAHAKIREDPVHVKKDGKKPKNTRDVDEITCDGKSYTRSKKIGLERRRAKVAEKIKAAQEKMQEE